MRGPVLLQAACKIQVILILAPSEEKKVVGTGVKTEKRVSMKEKRTIALGMSLAVGLAVFLCAAATSATGGENLVANGSFEGEFMGGVPNGWRKMRSIQRSLDEKVFHKGARSLRMQSDVKGKSAGIIQTVPVVGGRSYVLTVWRKLEGIQSKSKESLSCGIEVGGKRQFIDMGVVTGDSDWKRFVRTIRVPAGISKIDISFFHFHAKGTSWIDDVSLIDPNAASFSPKELLPNVGFESADAADANKPAGWKPLAKGVIKEACAGGKYGGGGYNGGKCAMAYGNDTGAWTGWETEIPVQPSTKYVVSGYTRASRVTSVQIVFPQLRGKTVNPRDWDVYERASTEWKPFKKIIETKADAPSFTRVLLLNEGGKEDIYFDDVSIKRFIPGMVEGTRIEKWKPGLPDLVVCDDVSRWKLEGSAKFTATVDPSVPCLDGGPSLKISADFPEKWTDVSIIPPKEVKITVPGGLLYMTFRGGPRSPVPQGYETKVQVIFKGLYGETYAVVPWMCAGDSRGDDRNGWREFRVPAAWDPKERRPALKYPITLERIVVYGRIKCHWDFWIGKAKFDRKNVWFQFYGYDRDAISPDFPSTPLFFGFDWAFGEYGDYYPKEVYANLELPPTVKVVGWNTRVWGDHTKQCRMETLNVKRDGKDLVRYRLMYPLNRQTITIKHGYVGYKRIMYYLGTDLQQGSVDAYYYMDVDGHTYPARKLPLDVVRIREVPTPKLLAMETCMLPAWPGGLDALKKLGLNRVQVSERDTEVAWVDEARKLGFTVSTSMTKGGMQKTLQEGGAPSQIGLNGKALGRTPCYTRAEKGIPYVVKHNRAALDKHITNYFFDDESWHRIQCFCPACLQGFQVFRKKHGKDLPDESPLEFVKRYEELELQHKKIDETTKALWDLWVDYHYAQYSRVAGLLKKAMDEYAQSIGLPAGSITFYDCWGSSIRDKLTARCADGNFEWFSCGGYYSSRPRAMADRLLKPSAWLEGTKVKHLPTYGPGICYNDLRNFNPREIMKWNVLEAFAVGVGGVYMWAYHAIDLLDWKHYSEAIWTVLPVEDIVVNGERADGDVSIVSGKALVRALKLGGECLVLISKYDRTKGMGLADPQVGDIDLTVRVKGVKKGMRIWNLNERKLVEEAKRETSEFKARLTPKERAVMYYVGNRKISR